MKPSIRPGLLIASLTAASWVAAPTQALVGTSSEGSSVAAYVVMVLQRDGARAGFCSGVVVARDAVLTAAHCVATGADIRVHFRDEAGTPVLLPVGEVLRHPGYRPAAIHDRERSIDLALIRLKAPLPDRFRPAALNESGEGTRVGAPFRIAGFGVTREGEGSSSGQLRVGLLTARAPLSKLLLWARDAKDQGFGACEGDSGGPVFSTSADQVAAITLWAAGSGATRCGMLTQALWIAPQRAWIDAILRQWGGKS